MLDKLVQNQRRVFKQKGKSQELVWSPESVRIINMIVTFLGRKLN